MGVTVVHPGAIDTRIIKSARTGGQDLGKMVRFFEKNGMSPEAAARQIVSAVKRNQMRLMVTREAWWADLLKRIFPTLGNKIAVRGMVKTLKMGPMLKEAAQKVEEAQSSTAS